MFIDIQSDGKRIILNIKFIEEVIDNGDSCSIFYRQQYLCADVEYDTLKGSLSRLSDVETLIKTKE